LRQFIVWVRDWRANSPNSLRRKVATLKNFFSYLRDEGYLATSPADPVPYPPAYVALPEFLEDDDALRLVEVTEDNAFWRALVVLMLDTGLKRDEVLALRVADIHLDDDDASGSYLVVRETDAAKRLRTRKLPVSERLRDALRAYYKAPYHVQNPPVPQPPRAGDSRVFDISVRGINFIVEECGKRAGIVTSKPRLTPQALRETFAVIQMRAYVQEERRCQARAWNGEQMQLLTLRHDAEFLKLLGLKEDPDTARKYRQLVKV
jgi:integrase